MTDLVVWSDPDESGQSIGTAGRVQMFVIGPDPGSGGFVMMIRDLFGSTPGMFRADAQTYAVRKGAELAAEDELVRLLAQLDAVTADLRAL